MNDPLNQFPVDALLARQRQWTEAWHEGTDALLWAAPSGEHDLDGGLQAPAVEHLRDLFALIERQHRANFDLWHEEDAARDRGASDARITENKHRIDSLNQQRNDLMERIDDRLIGLAGSQNAEAALHSETPGMIVDRLSILALRVYHTAAEATRVSASPEHQAKNLERLEILERQRTDLGHCLADLWLDVRNGRRRFQLYYQMKMYNDPTLNPVLYTSNGNKAGGTDEEAERTLAAEAQTQALKRG